MFNKINFLIFSLLNIFYIFAFRVIDSSDIDYHVLRLGNQDDLNFYYSYLRYFLSVFELLDNFSELIYNINYSYTRYFPNSNFLISFELYRFLFLILNLPALLISIYLIKRLSDQIGVYINTLFLIYMPGAILIFSGPSLDVLLFPMSCLVLLMLARSQYLLAVLSQLIYFAIFDDKGIFTLLIFTFAYIFIDISSLSRKFIFIISILLLTLPSSNEFWAAIASNLSNFLGVYGHYSNLIIAMAEFGKFPLLILIISTVSTTALSFTNFLFFPFFLTALVDGFKKIGSTYVVVNIFLASLFSFSFITNFMTSISSLRHYPFIGILFLIYLSSARIKLIELMLVSLIFSLFIFGVYSLLI